MTVTNTNVDILCYEEVHKTIPYNDFIKINSILGSHNTCNGFTVTDSSGNLICNEDSFEGVNYCSCAYYNMLDELTVNGITISHYLVEVMNELCAEKGLGYLPEVSFRISA